jgi:hypothetical protein
MDSRSRRMISIFYHGTPRSGKASYNLNNGRRVLID